MREDWAEIELGTVLLQSKEKYKPVRPEIHFYIGLEHIEKNTGRLTTLHDKEEITNIKNVFESDDILYGKLRPYLNKVYLAKEKGVCSTDIMVFRPVSIVNPRFALNYMLSRQFVNDMSNNTNGVNLPRVSTKYVTEYPFPLPPLPEQRAIVSKIEQLFSELDNGIANLKTAKQKLEIYRQAVLKKAFEGALTKEWRTKVKSNDSDFLIAAEPEVPYQKNQGHQENQRNHSLSRPSGSSDNLPEGWRWVKLGDFGKWKGGGTPSKSKVEYWENGDVLWVSPKDMKTKTILDTQDKITELSIEQSSAKWIEKGAILFVVRSGILRRTLPIALAGRRLTVNQDLQSFLPNDKLQSDFVYWYCVSQERDIREKCSKDGTTVESIESTLLKNYPLPLCSIEEQTQIVQEIESRLSVCDKLSVSIDESLEKAEALRQSILKKAFEGKLLTEAELEACRKEPDWEPAERLLERIVSEHDERIKR